MRVKHSLHPSGRLALLHPLHSLSQNSEPSKTLILTDSLLLNGPGHLFCDFVMFVIY